MGHKTRIPLDEAEALAREVAFLLRPACESVVVAGSIRRKRPDVGDMELVCVPTVEQATDLFGLPTGGFGHNELDALVDGYREAGLLTDRLDKNGRGACGSKYKRLAYKGFALDLFAVLPPASFGSLMAIRTGPGDFSHVLVTPKDEVAYDRDATPKRPLCAGLMPPWLKHEGGRFLHRATRDEYPTPTEESVFELLGLEWIAPEGRTDWIAARIAEYRKVGAR